MSIVNNIISSNDNVESSSDDSDNEVVEQHKTISSTTALKYLFEIKSFMQHEESCTENFIFNIDKMEEFMNQKPKIQTKIDTFFHNIVN